MKLIKILFVLLLMLMTEQVAASVIRVAVASNFANTMKVLSSLFEKNTGHQVKISIGSTGKHYAQIKNGAPFDLFFAADTRRPELLEKEGVIIAKSRFTYAQGKLVLWSPQQNMVDVEGLVLESTEFQFLAVANPKLAPYGRAAQQVLQKKGLWRSLTKRMVRGENIGQTYQFVKSGNAQLGFVAASQVKSLAGGNEGSSWNIPQQYYSAINQQAVLLKDNTAARDFLLFMSSEKAQSIIRDFGYELP